MSDHSAHPSVSTGTIPQGMSKDSFLITVTRRRKTFTLDVGPDTILGIGERIEGIRREIGARYCVLRDGNRCAINSPEYCIMGSAPFLDPTGADFDHINGDKYDHRAGNIRLACHPCNAHQQTEQRLLQWKSKYAPTSEGVRERASPEPPYSAREGQKHDWERPAWDDFLSDRSKSWGRLDKENLSAAGWYLLTDLVDLAGGTISDPIEGKGSSITFRRYAGEDRFTVLEMMKDKGRVYVRPRK